MTYEEFKREVSKYLIEPKTNKELYLVSVYTLAGQAIATEKTLKYSIPERHRHNDFQDIFDRIKKEYENYQKVK